MIIELSDDLIGGLEGRDLDALEVIAQARRSGYHLLAGSRDVFASVSGHRGLSNGARKILGRAGQRQVQKQNIIACTSWRICVSRGGTPAIKEENGVFVIALPLAHCRFPDSVGKPVVLGEGPTDAALMAAMARYYRWRHRIDFVALMFQPDIGGGNTTARSFLLHRDGAHLCVCVVDSDRRYPNGPLGSVAVNVLAEQRDDKPWARAVVMHCREAENVLPSTVMVDVLPGAEGQMPSLEVLSETQAGRAVRDYVDFKNGTRGKDVMHGGGHGAQSFWNQALRELSNLPNLRDECRVPFRCSHPDRCRCQVVGPFGRTLLEKAHQKLAEMTERDIESALCDATRPHWLRLGRIVFSWICGTAEMRV